MTGRLQLTVFTLLLSWVFGLALAQAAGKDYTSGFDSIVAANGDISLPTVDFRRDWSLLGVWIVNGEDDAKGMHNVYAERGVVDHYRKTGKFPDGAVLVKELLSTVAGDFTTGRISMAKAVDGWFVMVKDVKGRYPESGLWGDGWGWAYFESKEPTKLITKNYKEECLTCHIPAKETDWIYSEAYPILGEKRGGLDRLRVLLAEVVSESKNDTEQSETFNTMVDNSLVKAGANVFKRCIACHAVEPGKHKTGPSLAGVFGRKAGSAEGFNYSSAMKSSTVVWDAVTLDQHLADVPNFIPENRMGKVFRNGVKNADQRKAVIEFLKSK